MTPEIESTEEQTEQRTVPSFDAMDPVNPDGEWVKPETGRPLVGTLLETKEDVGENSSRLYKVRLAEPYPALEGGTVEAGDIAVFYGAAQLDQKVDRGGVGRGSIIGVLKTGERYTPDDPEKNEGYVYDVRTQRDADAREA